MKKKTLTERLNRYFSAEENAIHVPPIETMRAYTEFSAICQQPESRAEQTRKSVRSIRRFAVLAACLAVLLAAAVAVPTFISRQENQPGDSLESNGGMNGGGANKEPGGAHCPAVSDAQGDTSESDELLNDPGYQEGPECNEPGTGRDPEVFERYFPDECYDLSILSHLVTWEEIYAAENKVFAETSFFYAQLPPLYMMIHELNIQKEEFIRVNDGAYTDEQIAWLFSDADIQTIQAAFKLDTALLCNGRLYNLYELYEILLSDPSQFRELAGTEEMTAYLKDLDAHLKDPDLSRTERETLSALVNELKGAVS